MNNKLKALFGLIAFVVLIIVAYFSYNSLTQKYKPDNEIRIPQNQQASETKDSISLNRNSEQNNQTAKSSLDKQNSPADSSSQKQDQRIKVHKQILTTQKILLNLSQKENIIRREIIIIFPTKRVK